MPRQYSADRVSRNTPIAGRLPAAVYVMPNSSEPNTRITTARSVTVNIDPSAIPRRTPSNVVGEMTYSSNVPLPRSHENWAAMLHSTFCQNASIAPPMTTKPRYWRGACRPS